jgi:hypothetical protein
MFNVMEDPEISPHIYRHLIFENGAKNMHCRKDSLFNKWEDRTSTSRRLTLNP